MKFFNKNTNVQVTWVNVKLNRYQGKGHCLHCICYKKIQDMIPIENQIVILAQFPMDPFFNTKSWSLLLSPPRIALIKTHKGSLLSASLSFYNLGEQKVEKMPILLRSRARLESGFCCEGGPVTFRKDGQGCQLKRVAEESELIHGSQISCGQFVLWIFFFFLFCIEELFINHGV